MALETEVLLRTAAELEAVVTQRAEEIARLQNELRTAQSELELVRQMLVLRGEHLPSSNGNSPPARMEMVLGEDREAHESEADLAEIVIGILRKAGRTMTIGELYNAVKDAGAPIPGQGTAANLTVRISGRTEIVRPSRGVYGLREWNLVTRPTPVRRTRKTRTRKTEGRKARSSQGKQAKNSAVAGGRGKE
jgi:hypothetical protein